MDSSPEGGADNLSKKRAAFRQLTKDDDPDAEEENKSLTGTGSFKRASDEVLASRRIVKVRRTAPATSAPNPFASISLVPPSDLTLKAESLPAAIGSGEPSADKSKDATHDEAGKDRNGKKDQLPQENQKSQASDSVEAEGKGGILGEGSEETITGEVESTPTTEDAARIGETEVVQPGENGGSDLAESNRKAELSIGKEEGSTNSILSFQQHSTGINAFSGSFGTGFSKSSFSFGVTPSPFSSPVGFGLFGSSSSLGSTPFGSSLSTEGALPSFFGKNSGNTVAPFQSFGSQDEPATPANSGQQTQATVSLSEVPVETGEEKEKAVFAADATLFEFVDKAWKERGKGELRVNLSEDAECKARLVMRSKGNLRLLLNASLFRDMRLNRMDSKSITFACANSASTLKVGGLTTYALKLKDVSVSENFIAVVEAHKVSSSERKTQESPPGAPKENEDLTEEIQNATERPVEAADANESRV
ncbi:hypothetical protein O6H91_03G106400 [Diphasiastrum complanatum]|uniref:Uncharacterized protein n=8 Tax=Diphasiastrum complanatum TaxID=34168 RepID=A0ACC2EA18_DIPCM|nr:hypothetical protein O6H91_03G106400 [Diphasiastrum complanatum]KAJ7563346.1 hypothetical protein O6H91_03G106400 [Diphasiastrum complanatum]KAJ7563347.1 hypothetical protein O6H91_03G106400 [Diphasiastrum complanatum]KAJ7563348.1 hypothetical protein O6H91_03G106400 [Diphasiastrum complanatum]KAJ7563349.1 hypothetical protein O6H91_03G106400 [Diphasiastrum complanatum]